MSTGVRFLPPTGGCTQLWSTRSPELTARNRTSEVPASPSPRGQAHGAGERQQRRGLTHLTGAGILSMLSGEAGSQPRALGGQEQNVSDRPRRVLILGG